MQHEGSRTSPKDLNMKIAQIAPIWYRVPPRKYGGTEQVVNVLTEGLVKKGHEVTLFASGDSITKAKLVSVVGEGLLDQGLTFNSFFNPLYQTLNVLEKKEEFDILHFHFTTSLDYVNMALVKDLKNIVFTFHIPMPFLAGREDRKRLLIEKFNKIPLVSISNNQRGNFNLNFIETVYNGIEVDKYPFSKTGEDYILWLSIIARNKGTYEVAKVGSMLPNRKFKLVGKTSTSEEDITYFNEKVKPLINNQNITLYGEADFSVKMEYFKNAKVFLFPMQWEEPFGLVLIEAMVCGTPVVAYARGSAPEVIKDGETGFLVNPSEADIRGDWIIKKTGLAGLCEAIEKIYKMSQSKYQTMRVKCRKRVEDNFTFEKMVKGYEGVYRKIVKGL